MKKFVLETSVWLPKPLKEVFPFFADAYNLEEITPPYLQFEVLTPRPIPMRVGQTIDYKLKLRGIPIRWRSEIAAWEPPYRFVDQQLKGPYRLWHHEHRFREVDGMTEASDTVTYGVLGGALVNKLLVERDVQDIFRYRHERMQEIFGRVGESEIPRAA